MGLFALADIGEPVGLAQGEREFAIRQIEFRRSPSCLRTDEPLSAAAEGLRRSCELNPVVQLARLPVPSGWRVF